MMANIKTVARPLARLWGASPNNRAGRRGEHWRQEAGAQALGFESPGMPRQLTL